jgi:hypothetical protein
MQFKNQDVCEFFQRHKPLSAAPRLRLVRLQRLDRPRHLYRTAIAVV